MRAIPDEAGSDKIAAVVANVEVEPGLVSTDQNIFIERGTLYAGIVTDQVTGQPIKGVEVRALNPAEIDKMGNGGLPIGGAITGDDGRYYVRLPTGTSKIYIANAASGAYEYPEDNQDLHVKIDGSQLEIEGKHFELDPVKNKIEYDRFVLKGAVVDEAGEPIPNLALYYERTYLERGQEMTESRIRLGKTDRHGHFREEIYAYGKVRVLVGGSKYSFKEGEWISLQEEGEKDLGTFKLRTFENKLSGFLVDEDGNAIAGLQYNLENPEYFWTIWPRTEVDGRFNLGWVPEGPLELHFMSGGRNKKFVIEEPAEDIVLMIEGGL